MIQVEHLVKHYGQKAAVNDISFSIKEGEIVGFLGPNGAGKSTTMNIITGYLSADSGVVKVDGHSIFEDDIEAKKRIGFLPEQPPLYLDMSVKEYLGFVYDLKKAKSPNRQKHIDDICELVGISHVYKRKVGNLSKGYRQRVGLAQALIGSPPVLILDEPTVGLDPRQIIEIRNLIRQLGSNSTIILSSHILPEVQAVCERILVINNGMIVADGATESLANSTESRHRLSLRVAGEAERGLETLKDIAGVVSAEIRGEGEPGAWDFSLESEKDVDLRSRIVSSLTEKGYDVLQIKTDTLSLEDVFMQLVTDEPSGDLPDEDAGEEEAKS